jgi:hypothetical protein
MLNRQQLLQEYLLLPAEAQRQVVDFIVFLRQRYGIIEETEAHASIENEEFIGMWKGREEFEEGANWLRDLRKKEWRESL